MTDTPQNNKQVVERFWTAMQTNDFKSAGEFLHDKYVLEWPQSGEVIRGRENFVAVNVNYPAHGRWEINIHQPGPPGSPLFCQAFQTPSPPDQSSISFVPVSGSL